jgi:hypothetical protein
MKRSALKSEVSAVGVKLRLDKKFQPCAAEPGDELYPNAIFVFNITRLLAFIETQAERFPVESIELADIPDYANDESLDQEAIDAADTLRPILMAEIAPGRYNLIHGHDRVAHARREGARTLPAYKVRCPHHVPFLTSSKAYEKYLEYWNSKLKDLNGFALPQAPGSHLKKRANAVGGAGKPTATNENQQTGS